MSTICGVASGTPDGGVAIIRLSGPEAVGIAETVVGSLPEPRVLARRRLRIGSGAHEAGLVVLMPGPASYTGEDVVELHVHAGVRNVRSIIERLIEAGARAAGAGEFTRRAFVNARMSLDQAEGVAAIIGARTEAALDQARRLAAGELAREVEAVRSTAADFRTEIEAHLDFPDDVDAQDVRRWQHGIAKAGHEVRRWLDRFEAGRRARERARIVLCGPPNAGKSALFNALLGRRRAIVSEAPGTTRDYVEGELVLGDYEAVVVDTAGIRELAAGVEGAGIALSRDQIEGADVVIWVEGADAGVAEPHSEVRGHVIRVENKRDLGVRRPDWIGVSAVTGDGLERVRDALGRWFGAGAEPAWIGLARHRDRASEAADALDQAVQELGRTDALELVAFQLGIAERRLGEIGGRTALGPVGDEVLERIFARFCIGK